MPEQVDPPARVGVRSGTLWGVMILSLFVPPVGILIGCIWIGTGRSDGDGFGVIAWSLIAAPVFYIIVFIILGAVGLGFFAPHHT